jgi:hypothetical protein
MRQKPISHKSVLSQYSRLTPAPHGTDTGVWVSFGLDVGGMQALNLLMTI